jgi:hypothetical protein
MPQRGEQQYRHSTEHFARTRKQVAISKYS